MSQDAGSDATRIAPISTSAAVVFHQDPRHSQFTFSESAKSAHQEIHHEVEPRK
jgi:hypothetical protein